MSAPAVILKPEYLTVDETCQRLQLSPRTLEKWVKDKRIQSKLEPRDGRKPERVYSRPDVERIQKEREARAERQPETRELVKAPTPLSLVVPAELKEAAREIVREWASEVRAALPEVSIKDKLWLTWEEAVAYSGLPYGSLRKLAQERNILARKYGRSWRVNRESLEWSARYRDTPEGL